jgi:Malectin domain
MRISSFVTTCLWIGYCWSEFAVGSTNYFHESTRFETTTEYVDTSILSSSTSRDVDISTFRERDDLRYRNHVVDQRVLQRASPTTPLRIDCGSTKNWTDAGGNLWLSDRYFVNGWTRSDRCPTNISGTTLDTIYCSARFWQGTNNAIVTVYNIPASDGNYQVTLRFAELYASSVNARKLGIIVDGTQITTSPLDLFASVGRDMAYDVTVPVNVKSALTGNGIGNIKIQFLGYGSNIILNAIDVVPIMVSLPVTTPVSMPVTAPVSVPIPVTPQPIATPVVPISPVSIPKPVPALVPVSTVAPTNVPISLPTTKGPTTKVPTTKVQSSLSPTNAPVPIKVPVTSAPIIGVQPVIRINVGSDVTWTDKDTGFVWSADKYNYGFSGAFSGCSSNISGTDLDPVFCDYRSFFGPNGTVAGYNIPVSKPGLYTVNLYFAEVFFEDEGQRVFQVAVQGKVLAPLLDVFSLVGMNAAYVLNTVATVQVASAGINIELTTRVENAILNGIEILDGVHTPAPVTAPPPVSSLTTFVNFQSFCALIFLFTIQS